MRRAWVVLLALALAAVLLPLRAPRLEVSQAGSALGQSRHLRELTRLLGDARIRWIALAERDSALGLIARDGAGGKASRLWVQGFGGLEPAPSLTATWENIGKGIQAADSGVATGLLVYNAATYYDPSWRSTYSGSLITRVGGKLWCVAIAPGHLDGAGRPAVYRSYLNPALAPCALLAGFGPPGASVGRWLEATRYGSVGSNRWLTGRSQPTVDDDPWQWIQIQGGDEFFEEGFSLVEALGAAELVRLREPPYHYGAPGVRCLAGHRPSCTESVLRSALTLAPDPGVPPDLTGASLLRAAGVPLVIPRPPSGTYVSDLIEAKGHARFRAFWNSELPFEPAFEQAFGEPLGDWTAKWAAERWRSTWYARYRQAAIVLGADLAPSWPVLVLGWSALSVLLVASAAQRRQVT